MGEDFFFHFKWAGVWASGQAKWADQVGRCVGKWAGQVGRSSGQMGWVTCPLKKVVGKNTCCKHISFTTARAMESIPGSFSLWLVGGESSGQVCGQVGRPSGQIKWAEGLGDLPT